MDSSALAGPSIPMEHDGLANNPFNSLPPPSIIVSGDTTENNVNGVAPIAQSGFVAADDGNLSASNGESAPPQGNGTGARRRRSNSLGSSRIFCPVAGCPESLASSNRHFRDFAGIKKH